MSFIFNTFIVIINFLCIYGFSNHFRNLRNVKSLQMGDSPNDVAVVLLAGGKGTRMKSSIPKQFLPLLGRPVFLRSLDCFKELSCVKSIAIVLDSSFRDEYQYAIDGDDRIVWADPGTERQDSVYNGLQVTPDSCDVVAIHDAARPLVTKEEIMNVLNDGFQHGAAVLGVPMKATVKESEDGEFVLRTVPRSRLWEVHTPQVVRKNIILDGFKKVNEEGLEVTDDVSVIEQLGLPVKLTKGEYTNIKLTTPDDMQIAEQLLRERGVVENNNNNNSNSNSSNSNSSNSHSSNSHSSDRGKLKDAYECSTKRYFEKLEGKK